MLISYILFPFDETMFKIYTVTSEEFMMKHKLPFAIIFLSLLFTACNFSSNAPEKYEEPGNEPGELFKDILSSDEWTVTNPAAITYENKIYTFAPKQSTGGFKRTITVSQNSILKFAINTFIYKEFDGTLQFLIDDIVKAEYTGMNDSWQNEVFEIKAGDHTIEWKRNDSNPNWLTRWNNNPVTTFIKLKNFELKDFQPLTTINQTFESELDSDLWICNGLSATITEEGKRWPQSGDALVDTHGKIVKLATIDGDDTNRKWGNSYLKIFKISVQEETALSFDYKCDLFKYTDKDSGKEYAQTFKVFLDDASEPVLLDKGTSNWKKGTVILSAGSHSVTFSANRDPEKGYWYSALTNSVYLDNITLAANSIASVDIYPKGLQETYVGGFPIQFSAKALRSDGSVISDKSVSWSASGGSIDNNGKFTPGSSEGTISVTATIDGVSASNQNVKVHGTNYLTDPVTINGHTFTGEIKDGSGERQNTNKITFEDPTPAYSSFTTDGFFVLKGYANDCSVNVFVRKQGENAIINNQYNPDYHYQTNIIIPPGNFETRIWLRYGDGIYDVYIQESKITYCENYEGYEGAIYSYEAQDWVPGMQTYLSVTNSTDLGLSADDCGCLLPSSTCQSDDFLVSNGFNAVMAELSENASTGQKLQTLYDWVIDICHYDYVSFNNGESTNKRKKQDAAHVVKYGMGVCEGYANLYTALARLAGVKSTFQGSNNLRHGWAECYYKDQWKMVDPTWDDPSDESVTESIPNSGSYNYFLIDPNDQSHYKDGVSDKETDYSRTVGIK